MSRVLFHAGHFEPRSSGSETPGVSDWIDAEWVEDAAAALDKEADGHARRGFYDAATYKANLAAYLRWSWEKLEGGAR